MKLSLAVVVGIVIGGVLGWFALIAKQEADLHNFWMGYR